MFPQTLPTSVPLIMALTAICSTAIAFVALPTSRRVGASFVVLLAIGAFCIMAISPGSPLPTLSMTSKEWQGLGLEAAFGLIIGLWVHHLVRVVILLAKVAITTSAVLVVIELARDRPNRLWEYLQAIGNHLTQWMTFLIQAAQNEKPAITAAVVGMIIGLATDLTFHYLTAPSKQCHM